MLDAGFSPKETTRKSNYVIYFKHSESIEDFLTSIGAPLAAMQVMNAKAEKYLRNGVNRRVNCDSANLTKAVDAAWSRSRPSARWSAGEDWTLCRTSCPRRPGCVWKTRS